MESCNTQIDSEIKDSSSRATVSKRTLSDKGLNEIYFKRRKMYLPRTHTKEINKKPTFANDRLKKLREKICSDVVPSTSTINPDILANVTVRSSGSFRNVSERKCDMMSGKSERIELVRNNGQDFRNEDERIQNISITSKRDDSSNLFAENRNFHNKETKTEDSDQSYLPRQHRTPTKNDQNSCDFSNNRINVEDISNFEIETEGKRSKNYSGSSSGNVGSPKNKKRLLRINPASFAIMKKQNVNENNISNLKEKVELALRETDNISESTFGVKRKVENTKGLFSISIPNKNVHEKADLTFFKSSENVSVPYSPTEPYINPEFQQTVQEMWRKKNPEEENYCYSPLLGKSLSSVQDRLKKNRLSSPNFPSSTMDKFTTSNDQKTISLPNTPTFPHPLVPKKSNLNENAKDFQQQRSSDVSEKFSLFDKFSTNVQKSSSSPTKSMVSTSIFNKSIRDENTNEFSAVCAGKQNSKFCKNYGEIVNVIYEKYFGNCDEDYRKDNEWNIEEVPMDWEYDNEGAPSLNMKKGKEMYIVVDTNIFLEDLNTLKEIVNCGSTGGTKPILYVPWMVLKELDYMKDDNGNKLKFKAQHAVHFINKTLSEGDRKLLGQNVFKAEEQKYVGKDPDDKILACCLQAKIDFKRVVLLSNDVNLKNKAMVNAVPAFTTEEMLKIERENSRVSNIIAPLERKKEDNRLSKIMGEMGKCCSFLICECALEAYGSAWNKLGMLKSPPPWELEDCVQIFKRYWTVIFKERLLKQCLKNILILEDILKELKRDKSEEKFEEFFNTCMDLCIFFRDLEEHQEFVDEIVRSISRMKNETEFS